MIHANEAAVLGRFVGLLLEARPAPGAAASLPGHLLQPARLTYFLVHRSAESDARTGVDSQSFVAETLERLLQQLSVRTERRLVEHRGRVRGRISWPATLKSRYSGDYDPSRFVCREAKRHFDTPENQLLRYVVEALWRALREVPPVMRSGASYFPASGRFAAATIGEQILRLEVDLSRLRRHARLREVTLPAQLSNEHLLAAETSKLEEYGLAARLYRLYADSVLEPRPGALGRLARSGLPLPGEVGPEAEPWLRLAASLVRGE